MKHEEVASLRALVTVSGLDGGAGRLDRSRVAGASETWKSDKQGNCVSLEGNLDGGASEWGEGRLTILVIHVLH